MKCLIMFYPRSEKTADWINQWDEIRVVNALKKDVTKDIVVLLNSNGGDMHAAYKLINIIRKRCEGKLTIVVPHYAKSAATLICLGADRIVMGSQSELGPLDPQINSGEGWFSALDTINPLSMLANQGQEIGKNYADQIQKLDIPICDAARFGTQYSSNYIETLVSQLDPRKINVCFRLLSAAQTYGRTLLDNFMFSSEKDPSERLNKAQEISNVLVWKYPDHGYAINYKEALALGLNIIPAEEFKYWNKLWKKYMSLLKDNVKVISWEDI